MKYDVFISYSRKDYVDEQKEVIPGNEVSKIKEALRDAGITFWFDEDGIYSGDNFTDKIVTNIEAARIFLFLSTYNSNNSRWTCREIACADELKKCIIPVRIDQTPYNKKVMFRIADLDYIDYYVNAEKGLSDLIKSIKAYLANERAREEQKQAEEEARRQREEMKQQHEQQIKILRSEIDKLDTECAEMEKLLLQQQHQVDTTRIELNAKRKRLDEQKAQLNYILYGNPSHQGNSTEQTSSNTHFSRHQKEGTKPVQRETTSILTQWSWGGFVLSWIWGVFNGVYWTAILIPIFLIGAAGKFLTIISIISFLCISIYLGRKGHELAWHGKRNWNSAEAFEKEQGRWNLAAKVVAALCILYIILLIIETALKGS